MNANLIGPGRHGNGVDPVTLVQWLSAVYRADLPAQVIGQVVEELSYLVEEEQEE